MNLIRCAACERERAPSDDLSPFLALVYARLDEDDSITFDPIEGMYYCEFHGVVDKDGEQMFPEPSKIQQLLSELRDVDCTGEMCPCCDAWSARVDKLIDKYDDKGA